MTMEKLCDHYQIFKTYFPSDIHRIQIWNPKKGLSVLTTQDSIQI